MLSMVVSLESGKGRMCDRSTLPSCSYCDCLIARRCYAISLLGFGQCVSGLSTYFSRPPTVERVSALHIHLPTLITAPTICPH